MKAKELAEILLEDPEALVQAVLDFDGRKRINFLSEKDITHKETESVIDDSEENMFSINFTVRTPKKPS